MKVTYFAIHSLFGKKNVEVTIEDNKLIIVAENGAGKTTLLRIFYLFLSKQWNTLIEYNFEKVVITIDEKEYSFVKSEYSDTAISKETIQKLIIEYPSYKKFFEEELIKYSVDRLLKDDFLIGDIETKYDVPRSLLYSVLKEINSSGYDKNKYDWNGTFLYLPTYRRIERGFSLLYGDINKRLEQHIRQLLPETDLKIHTEKKSSNSSYSETENDLLSIFEIIWEKRDFERWSSKHDGNFHMELIEFGMV
jgi:energy-coupling factor transporter ATP-binding protein EcfA2